MTNLEIIFCEIIWILYGLYAVSKTTFSDSCKGNSGHYFWGIMIVIFAPIVFVLRLIYGVFIKKYHIND